MTQKPFPFPKGGAGLAPMAGVADTAFRTLCRSFGAVLTVSEMVSAKGLCYASDGSFALCRITPPERPMGIQLFGSDADTIARAVTLIAPFSPDWVDLNMGCPVRKVVRDGCGADLMRHVDTAQSLVRAAAKNCDCPVTVKMRLGWSEDEKNAVEFAKAMEDAGASALTVHGRTAAQMYSGIADWDAIRTVKQAVTIPVIGNGDVQSARDAQKMYETTGCDLVLIGRASYGNPFVFREIAAAQKGMICPTPSPEEKMDVMVRHIQMILDLSEKPERKAMCEARKHASWYMRGMKGAAVLRNRCYALSTMDELKRLARDAVNAAKS